MKFIDDAIKESEQRMEEKAPEKLSSDIDDDLIEMIKGAKTNIFVVGAGGAGNNTISRLNEMGIEGATTIAVNTDAQDLFYSQSAKKILLGRQTSKGLGAGGEPSVGEECAEESEDEIREELEGADMVFVTCGLGGGTGTGSAPIIAKIAKKLGALTVAVATLPFSAEGIMVSDEILGRAVKGITELITKKGLVSLDFADIRSIMGGSGMAMIGMGESDTGDRALESVHEALSSPLLDIDISNATGALVNISGSSDLTLHEAEKIVQVVADKLDPEANIIWGTQIDESLQNTVRTTVVVSGIKSNYEVDSTPEIEYAEEKEEPETTGDQLDDFIDGIF